MWCIVRELPGEGEHIARYRLENVRIDGVHRIAGLVKMRVRAPADHGYGRHTSFFKRNMIAAREKAEHIQLVRETGQLADPFRRAFLKT